MPFRVAFVQIVCPRYKLDMFRAVARAPGVSLTLYAGDTSVPGHAPSGEVGDLPHRRIRNVFWRLCSLNFVWQRLGDVLDPRDYDLVVLPEGLLYLSNYVMMIRCWLRRTPFGLYSHGYNYQARSRRSSRLREGIRGAIHRRCDVLIVYSDDGARHVACASRVPADRIFIARNTLDVETIAQRTRAFPHGEVRDKRTQLGAGGEDVLLVFVGRIVRSKRPEWVVEAVRRLRSRGLPVKAAFIGDGDASRELRATLAEQSPDVRSAIQLAGYVPFEDVDLCLRAADLVVMPGVTGLAYVHAAAAGRPFVTVASPSHGPEIAYVDPGVTGLIAQGTVDGFCEAVRYLAENPEARERMGRLAQERVLESLTADRQVTGFLQAFERVRKAPR